MHRTRAAIRGWAWAGAARKTHKLVIDRALDLARRFELLAHEPLALGFASHQRHSGDEADTEAEREEHKEAHRSPLSMSTVAPERFTTTAGPLACAVHSG